MRDNCNLSTTYLPISLFPYLSTYLRRYLATYLPPCLLACYLCDKAEDVVNNEVNDVDGAKPSITISFQFYKNIASGGGSRTYNKTARREDSNFDLVNVNNRRHFVDAD